MTYYRQCILLRGMEKTTTWLPEKYAKQDKFVSFDNEFIGLGKGWIVISVGEERQTEEQVIANSQDYKHQREGSDI